MNKNVLVIIFCTLLAILLVYLASFGLLPRLNSLQNKGSKILSSNKTQTIQVNNANIPFAIFRNTEIAQNHYTVKLPQYWQIVIGNENGSYQATFDHGNATIATHDVPDNSTLELYVLSQDEPLLKNSLMEYKKIGYQKLSVNGFDAYQLHYQYINNHKQYEAIRTFVTGQDKSGLLTFAVEKSQFNSLKPLFSTILNSFKWENN